MNQTIIDTIAPRLTELVIKKIEALTGDWQKPWIADMTHGLPRNLRGTPYRAGNVLMLLFLSEIMGYRTPVFMTFRQAKGEGLNIRKGSDAFPVYFWKMYVRHKETRKKIELAEYYRLPKEQQKHYDLIPVMRYYPVFNLDQTDMQEQQPERYAQLTAKTVWRAALWTGCWSGSRGSARFPSNMATEHPIHPRSIGSSARRRSSSRKVRRSIRHYCTK